MDLIDRQAAIDAVYKCADIFAGDMPVMVVKSDAYEALAELPSAQAEQLTDKEQRIFLAAMGREEKVCKEVDRNYVREPYEDSLMQVCKEIRRKVKGALWT